MEMGAEGETFTGAGGMFEIVTTGAGATGAAGVTGTAGIAGFTVGTDAAIAGVTAVMTVGAAIAVETTVIVVAGVGVICALGVEATVMGVVTVAAVVTDVGAVVVLGVCETPDAESIPVRVASAVSPDTAGVPSPPHADKLIVNNNPAYVRRDCMSMTQYLCDDSGLDLFRRLPSKGVPIKSDRE